MPAAMIPSRPTNLQAPSLSFSEALRLELSPLSNRFVPQHCFCVTQPSSWNQSIDEVLSVCRTGSETHTGLFSVPWGTHPPAQLVMMLEDFLLRTALSGAACNVYFRLKYGP